MADEAVTFERLMRLIRAHHLGVLSTLDAHGAPHAAAVTYAASQTQPVLYAMTRSHLAKARNLQAHHEIAFVIPLERRLLRFVPPPTIQFQGTAEILVPDHPEARDTYGSFLTGRAILQMYAAMERRGDKRACFVRIRPGPVMLAYGVAVPIWELVRHMGRAIARVDVPQS